MYDTVRNTPDMPKVVRENTTPEEAVDHKYIEKRAKRRARLVPKLAATTLLLSGLSAAYWTDVGNNMEREKAASIQLDAIGGPIDRSNDSSTTIFIDGYGSKNADFMAEKLALAPQQIIDGSTKAVNFSDAPVETSHLAQEVLSQTSEEGITHASFFGFSAGGIMEVQASREIVANSDLRLDVLYLTSTPFNEDSLRDERREQAAWLTFLAGVPGAKYSNPVRWLISTLSDFEQYNTGDPGDFVKVAAGNWDEVINHKEPVVKQLDDQVLTIFNADLEGDLAAIGALRGQKQMPTVVYLAAENSELDPDVDNELASQKVCESAQAAGLTCLVYKVPTLAHSIYSLDATSIEQVLAAAKPEIMKSVEKERSLYDAALSFSTNRSTWFHLR